MEMMKSMDTSAAYMQNDPSSGKVVGGGQPSFSGDEPTANSKQQAAEFDRKK
ncbi:hypothetical protein Q3G72_002255 [Acer saccharum]|nr:hypothetical protein Q3G72_002255 [Acer saccharum]